AALVASVTAAFAGGGLGGVFTAWQTYLLIIVGPGFFVLLQETMKAGRLIASQPGLTLSNPIVAFVIGITIFGERVRTGGWLAGWRCRAAGLPQLADHRSDDEPDTTDESQPRSKAAAGAVGAWTENQTTEKHGYTRQDAQPQPIVSEEPRGRYAEGVAEVRPDEGDDGAPDTEQYQQEAACGATAALHRQA